MTDIWKPRAGIIFRLSDWGDRACLTLLVIAVALPLRFDLEVGPFKTFSLLDGVLIFVLSILIYQAILKGVLYLGPTQLRWVMGIPLILALLSIMWSENATLSIVASIKYLYSVISYFVAYHFSRNCPIDRMGRYFVLIAMGWILGSVAMYIGLPFFSFFTAGASHLDQSQTYDLLATVYTRFSHPYLGLSNDYGPLLAFVGFVALGIGRQVGSKAIAAAGQLALAASILTLSRGLLVGLAIGGLFYIRKIRLQYSKIARATFASVALLVLFSITSSAVVIELEDRSISFSEVLDSRANESNIEARFDGYIDALELIAQRPLFGNGVGYYRSGTVDSSIAVHNALLEQMKYFGLIFGLVTFSAYIAIFLFFSHYRSNPSLPSKDITYAVGAGWIVLLISSMFGTFFEATVPRAVIFISVGLLVGTISKPGAGRRVSV